MLDRTDWIRRLAPPSVALASGVLVLGGIAMAVQEGAPPADPGAAGVRIRELTNRGRALRDQGRIDASIETFEEAQRIALGANLPRDVIELDSQLVASFSRAGRESSALDVLRRTAIRVEELEHDPDFVAMARVHVRADISQILQRLGRRNEALQFAQDAVQALETTRDAAARGSAFSAMAGCLLAMDRPAEARTWWVRANEEAESLDPTDPRRIQAGVALAQCLGMLGDAESALDLADELVDRFEALGSFSASLGAKVYSLRGQLRFYEDWPAAEADLRRSLSLLKAAGVDEGSASFQKATLRLAHAVRNTGRPEESAALERRVLSVLREHLPESESTAIEAAQFLAASLRDLYERTGERGQLEESRTLLEEAARRSRELDNPNAGMIFSLLGELLLDPLDDARAAEPWLRAAVDAIESRSSGALVLDETDRADLLQERRLGKRHDPYEGLLRCLVRLDRFEEAFEVLERSRARGLVDLLERGRVDSLQQALDRAEELGDRATAERLRRLPREIDDAMSSLALARASGATDSTGAAVKKAHEQLRRLEDKRAELTRSVANVGTVASIDSIRGALERDEVLLAYFLGRKGSFVCLADAAGGRIDWFPLRDDEGKPLTVDAVEAVSQAWVEALSRGLGDPARGLTPSKSVPEREVARTVIGHRLFRTLVPPGVWQRLRDRTSVHLMPHGPLNRVPFEALVVEPEGDDGASVFWIDRGPAITYQESGSALVWSKRRREEQEAAPEPGLALIVADPDYGDVVATAAPSGNDPVVVRVQRGSAAAREGLCVGDSIRSLAGTRIESTADFEKIRRDIQDPLGAPLVVVRSGVERMFRLPRDDPGIEVASSLPAELSRGVSLARSTGLERLPGTAREAAAVRSALEQSANTNGRKARIRILEGDDANETLLTAWAPNASILHIAAHQIPDPNGCTASGRLALTTPRFPTADDDGYVDLDDLLIHWQGRLEHCGLAVLSSCWSRTGRLLRDEGFLGLPLGLRFAGCPSIVSSLWPVDDDATAQLMSTFYSRLETKDPTNRLAALQESKRALKRERPDPYYWAAFVWSGAPR